MPDGDLPADLPPALAEALRRARADREHGASFLAREAAQALSFGARPESGVDDPTRRLQAVHAAAHAFTSARPSMAALANTAARIWSAGASPGMTSRTADERLDAIATEAGRLIDLWHTAGHRIVDLARPLLMGTLYTHSRSGTVEHTLIALSAEPTSPEVHHIFVAESRPGGEGVPAAAALGAAGWQVTLVPDAACGLYMPQCAAVVVGADSVRADGSIVNKVGTFPLSLAAQAHRVPVYVVCETLKIAAPDFPLVLEQLPPDAIVPNPPPGVTVRSPAFDHTPAALVAHVITEQGVLTAAEVSRCAADAARDLALLHAS